MTSNITSIDNFVYYKPAKKILHAKSCRINNKALSEVENNKEDYSFIILN